jgi:hypothetical protein
LKYNLSQIKNLPQGEVFPLAMEITLSSSVTRNSSLWKDADPGIAEVDARTRLAGYDLPPF